MSVRGILSGVVIIALLFLLVSLHAAEKPTTTGAAQLVPQQPASPLKTKAMSPASQSELKSLYGKKPAKTEIADRKDSKIYVPKDLDDCFVELKRILPQKTFDQMKTAEEKDMIRYHHGLGTWLRNNWIRQNGSRLRAWFNDRGIFHPDDMSGIIFDSFWRHIHNKPIKLDEQFKHYQDYWERVKK